MADCPRSFQQKIVRRLRVVEKQLKEIKHQIDTEDSLQLTTTNAEILNLTNFLVKDQASRIEGVINNFRRWEANKGNAGPKVKRS